MPGTIQAGLIVVWWGLAASRLQQNYSFQDTNVRMRYIIFSESVGRTWNDRGVHYITFDECIKFLIDQRSPCWVEAGIGVRSVHDQWPAMIKDIFKVANDSDLDSCTKHKMIRQVLDGNRRT